MIPYGRQDITQADIDAVSEVLQSDFLTQGPTTPLFEKTVAKHVGANYAVAVNSATSALHVACLALGLGKGDILWTSPITFVASANCGLYCGAKIDFVDIDPVTYNLCPKALARKLEQAELDGELPKVVIPVHLTGQSCNMKEINRLAERYGFKIIEDASHAIGGKHREGYIGCGRYSDITVFSFHPVKIITTGEGGMALTNDHALAEKMRLLRSHGVTRDSSLMTHEPDGPWYYQQVDLGFNYRMTELQSALGLSQMQRLDQYVHCRNELADRYDELLAGLPLTTPVQCEYNYSARHLYVIQLDLDETRKSRIEIFKELRSLGVGVNVHYIPVHMQPYYQGMGFSSGDYPRAEQYYCKSISIPLFHSMSYSQQDVVVSCIKKVLLN